MDYKRHRDKTLLILTIVCLFIDAISSQTTPPECSSVLRGRGHTVTGYNLTKVDSSRVSPLSELEQGTWCPENTDTERWLDIKLGTPWAVKQIKISEIASVTGDTVNTLTISHISFQPLNDNDARTSVNQQIAQSIEAVRHPTDPTTASASRTLTLSPALGSRRLWIEIGTENNCFTFELLGCPSHELCPAGCDNRGLCSRSKTCTCANGWGGDMCDLQQAPLPAVSDIEPLGMEDGRIIDTQLRVSSNAQDKSKARLGCCYDDDEGAWCPDPSDRAPYFEVEFVPPTEFYAYQFNFPTTHSTPSALRVKNYMLTFDMVVTFPDGQEVPVKDSIAAKNGTVTIISRLSSPVNITKFRVVPKNFVVAPCFRFELYKRRIVQTCNPACPVNAECTAGTCICRQGYIGPNCTLTKMFVTQRQHILTFLRIEQHALITSSLTFTTIGTPQLIPGRFGIALLLNGRNTSIRLQQTDLTFLSTTQTVERGFTIKLDVNIMSLLNNTYILTNGGDLPTYSGISLFYRNGEFVLTVSTTTQIWRITVSADRIPLHAWQTLQMTWSLTTGLEFFVNQNRIGANNTPIARVQPSTTTAGLSIGFPSMIISTVVVNHAHILVENIKIWEVEKTLLEELRIVPPSCPQECQNGAVCQNVTGVCECNEGFSGIACQISENTVVSYTISFNLIEQLRINHSVEVSVIGNPLIIDNRVIVLNQSDQYITIRTPDQCFRNIDLCFTGFTVALDLQIIRMPVPGNTLWIVSPGERVISKPGVSVYIESNTLFAVIRTTRQEWRVVLPNIVQISTSFQFLYSWSLETGLLVYIDNVLRGVTSVGTSLVVSSSVTSEYNFTIGGTIITTGAYPSFQVGNVVTWSTTSIGLQQLGLLELSGLVPPPTSETTSYISTELPVTTLPPTSESTEAITTELPITTLPPTSKSTDGITTELPDATLPPTSESAEGITTELPITTLPTTSKSTDGITTELPDATLPPTSESAEGITTELPVTTLPPTSKSTEGITTELPVTTLPPTSESTEAITTGTSNTTEDLMKTTTTTSSVLLEWNLSSLNQANNVITIVDGVQLRVDGVFNTTSNQLIFGRNEPHHLVVQNLPVNHCLINLGMCSNGFTIELGVIFQSLIENTFLISTGGEIPNAPGIAMVYRYGGIHVIVSTTTHTWYATIQQPPQINERYDYVITWQLNQQLRVYVQNVLIAESVAPVIQQNNNIVSVDGVYFLWSSTTITARQTFHGVLHTLRIWGLERNQLEIDGLINPAEATTTEAAPPTEPITCPTERPITCPTVTPITCPTELTGDTCPAGCIKEVTVEAVKPTEPPVTCPTVTPVTCPTEFPPGTCPSGCIKEGELNNTSAPDPPRNPVVTAETYDNGQKARFVCTFERNPGSALVTAVTWFSNNVIIARRVVGTASRAVLEPTEIDQETTYGKTICCAVQSVTSGACGEFSSVAIRSVQCVELRMTLITDSVSVTEGQNTPGVIQINFAMHPYLLCVSRFGSACRVAIQTSVAGRVRPNRRCPGGYSVPELVVTSQGIDCGRVIESTTIDSFNVTVEVQATIDGVIDSLKRPGVQISCVTYSETITTPQINHVLGNVQVSVANGDRRATCASTGDPHIRTFDGFGYNSFVQGEFVFYQHKTLPYAVHAQHARCSSRSSATCTCRVAVKSGDDVILFTGCQSRRRGRGRGRRTWYMSIDLYMNGDLTEGTRIMRMGSTSKYEVVLPTGTVVTVLLIRGGFMNLWVTASSVDYQQSEGLCGFYDSRRSNDLVGGGRNPRRFRARSRAQNTFSNTWKILGAASIYTGVQIDTTLISGQPFADCRSNVERRLGHGLPVVRCTRPSGTDVTTTIVRSARHPISTQSRSKRQADIEPIDLDEPLDESNFTIPMNESKAFCQELVDNSTVADKCKAILNETDYSEQVQNCADDYAITGDKEWGASHISDILEQCTSAIHTSEDLMNDTNADLVEAIQADSCIEACGRNGTCHDSVCICDAGFSGDTCSISKETTPDVDDLPRDNDPCDIDTGAPCRGIIITGSDFVESDNLTCHIKYVNVGASIELTGYDTSSKADFLSENLVQCVLPKEQSAYIYISNDGESLSNTSFLHVIYNKRCQECQYHPATSEADDASASCIDRDVCVINDICYAPNELNSEDSCQECDPKQSRTAWTQRTTPECTKEPIGDPGDEGGLSRDEKIVMAVVIPVAAVALIVGVSYACYRKRKSAHKKKKQSQMYHKAEHQYETTQVHDGYDNIGFKTGSGAS